MTCTRAFVRLSSRHHASVSRTHIAFWAQARASRGCCETCSDEHCAIIKWGMRTRRTLYWPAAADSSRTRGMQVSGWSRMGSWLVQAACRASMVRCMLQQQATVAATRAPQMGQQQCWQQHTCAIAWECPVTCRCRLLGNYGHT